MAVKTRRNTVRYSKQPAARVVSQGTVSHPTPIKPQKGRFRPNPAQPNFIRVPAQGPPTI